MNTYQYINGTCAISVNDWCLAGLSVNDFQNDSKRGMLNIISRGWNGNTLIDVRSIRRPERRAAIEAAYGPIEEAGETSIYRAVECPEARAYYIAYHKPDGSNLEHHLIEQYTNRASLLEALKRGLEVQRMARAKAGKPLRQGEWYRMAMEWYNEQREKFPCAEIKNARSFERVFKAYCSDGFSSIVSAKIGNDNSRRVSVPLEGLLRAIYVMNGKPFASEVYQRYCDFVTGDCELYDPQSGEIYRPEDFRYKDRDPMISESTVWRVLKNVVANTADYADRNGNFAYANKLRPYHSRHVGQYSLSKVSMDDVALSRKCKQGWIYKYIAVDVVSGYIFRPSYLIGKPGIKQVEESFRNMFGELYRLGLPIPGELDVEHHLMKDIDWLNQVFPFVTFNSTARSKRAEHYNKAFKYGAAHQAGHTRGRWYSPHEAYSSVRTKVDGDMVEPVFEYEMVVADDLADIEAHNNGLHPLQKTYPGMTRRDVLLSQANPTLRKVEPWFLFRYLGLQTKTSIRNNNHVRCCCRDYELSDFGSLDRLEPNNRRVTAYYLPDEEGYAGSVYLYQGDTYIGEATDRDMWKYNECRVERTAEDEAKMLHQQKRIAKFDAKIRKEREALPKVAVLSKAVAGMADVETRIVNVPEPVIGVQPKGYEEDEMTEVRALNEF